MTIVTGNEKRRIIDFLSLAYQGHELKPVDEYIGREVVERTPMQEAIERTVTNGRGYLSLGGSIKLSNLLALEKYNSEDVDFVERITLPQVLKSGIVPIFFETPMKIPEFSNPCGEVALGELQEGYFPFAYMQRTLFEKVDNLRTPPARSCFFWGEDRSDREEFFYERGIA